MAPRGADEADDKGSNKTKRRNYHNRRQHLIKADPGRLEGQDFTVIGQPVKGNEYGHQSGCREGEKDHGRQKIADHLQHLG
jgi:hypothetical protein